MNGFDSAESFLLALRADGKSPKTIATYRKVLRRLALHLFSPDIRLLDATQDDLIRFRCAIQDDQLAPRTQHLYSTVPNVFYRWALEQELIAKHPGAKLKGIPALPTVATPPRRADFNALVSSIPLETPSDYRDRAMLLFLAATGLRVSELCSLRNGQIDLTTGEFEILGKGRKRRPAWVLGRALDALVDWVKVHRPKLHRPGVDALWISDAGGALYPNKVRDIFAARRDAAGIDSVRHYPSGKTKSILTPHSIRHLFATGMLQSGVSLLVIKEALGHESLETTQVYLSCSREDQRDARLRLDALDTIAA